ncbi:hypothetical protein LZP73_11400 [Shewanella sp. AS16]|uniref:hypothetical protein n=1 Tax=Shewanella sp. AS16 TaxID=2907625 RepID=UPI001F2CAD21|nr:hypothetical protein [Shewanella sp. AS16]MCE9686797.1 hypothetical protein [Shewanella sp. AS16]
MVGLENRRRLRWKASALQARELLGTWVDERPRLGDKITFYREDDKWYLETWFNDGCHSLDEVIPTPMAEGLKLEDKGGNLFAEYFIIDADSELYFCNAGGRYYKASKVTPMRVA